MTGLSCPPDADLGDSGDPLKQGSGVALRIIWNLLAAKWASETKCSEKSTQRLLACISWTSTGSPTGKENQHVENMSQGLAEYHIPRYLPPSISGKDSTRVSGSYGARANLISSKGPYKWLLISGGCPWAYGNRGNQGREDKRANGYLVGHHSSSSSQDT